MEDRCSAHCLQQRVGEQIICSNLPVIFIGGELMLPVSLRRELVTPRIVYSGELLFITRRVFMNFGEPSQPLKRQLGKKSTMHEHVGLSTRKNLTVEQNGVT
jgi:hypothetical protein